MTEVLKKKKVTASKSGFLAFNDELMVDDDMDQDLFAACNEPAPAPAPRTGRMSSVMNRRRSSMGIAGTRRASISESEQVRIVEMYKTVIQMSSENKLTEKNSWNYDLIDHMGRLIKDESVGVNFQKASCTLDASVKIYSNRVDDTYASSHRILESLSRGGNRDGGGDEFDALGEKPKAKVGSKASSSRLNATDTIERNPSALNSVKLENDYAFDPTFHKLSKAFDEGGAKGMLMYNMRVSKRDCSLAFVRTTVAKGAQPINGKVTLVDMQELRQRSGLTVEIVSRLNICAKLQEYRDILREGNNITTSDSAIRSSSVLSAQSLSNLHRFESFPSCSLAGVIASPTTTRDSVDNSYESSTIHASNPAMSPGRPNHTRVPFASQSEDGSAVDPTSPIHYQAEDDGGIGDYWSPVYNVDEPARSPITRPTFDVPSMKLRWSLDGTNENHGKENQRALQQSLEVLTAANDYAYFDLDAITTGGSNAWAGSQHWRYATRSRSQPQEVSRSSDTMSQELPTKESKNEPKKKATKKEAQGLVFSLALVDEKKFSSTKSRTDTTIMTRAAQSKAEEDSALLLLPVDEKFQVKDLCRLSLWPNVVVAPANMNPLSLSTGFTSTGIGKNRAQILVDFMTGGETLHPTDAGMSGPSKSDSSNIVPIDIRFENAGLSEGDNAEFDYGDAGGDYYGDDVPTSSKEVNFASEGSPPVLNGLDINVNNLVQADRTVEKINIKYEKVSKRVNVHKLKTDILHHIHDNLDASTASTVAARHSQESSRNLNNGLLQPEMSFQNIVKSLSSEMQQKDVTVPYYFICLLHLANEETLKISDRSDLTDLTIKFD